MPACLQDLVVCRKDASDQQECVTSSATAHPSSQTLTSPPDHAPAEDISSGTHVADVTDKAAVQHSKHQAGSAPHPADAAMAESELMAENVAEAVQRLTSSDATATSSTGVHATSEDSAATPVLTSPTSLALPAADAYNRLTHTHNVDDDSDSEYGLEFNPYSFLRTLPPLAEVVAKHQTPLLPPQTRRFCKKTLVLDLDETLVRCNPLWYTRPLQEHNFLHGKQLFWFSLVGNTRA